MDVDYNCNMMMDMLDNAFDVNFLNKDLVTVKLKEFVVVLLAQQFLELIVVVGIEMNALLLINLMKNRNFLSYCFNSNLKNKNKNKILNRNICHLHQLMWIVAAAAMDQNSEVMESVVYLDLVNLSMDQLVDNILKEVISKFK